MRWSWLVVLFATSAGAQSLVFRGAPDELRLIGRTEAIRVERLDGSGQPAGGAALVVSVTAPPGAEVSPDPQPIGSWASTVQVNIGAGVSLSAPVYFRSGVRGVRTWRANAAGFSDATVDVLVRDDALTCTMESGTTLDTEAPAGCFNVLVRPSTLSSVVASASAAHRGAFGLRFVDGENVMGDASDISLFDHGARAFGDHHVRAWVRLVASNGQPSPIIAQLTNGSGESPSLADVKLKPVPQITLAGFTSDAGYSEQPSDAGLVLGTWHLLEFGVIGAGDVDGGRYVFLDGRLIARQDQLDYSGTRMPVAQFTVGEPYADSRRWMGTIDFDDLRTAAVPHASTLALAWDGGSVGACVPAEAQLRSSFGALAATREGALVSLDAGGGAELFVDSSCGTRGNQLSIAPDASVVAFTLRALGPDVSLEASSQDFLPGRVTWRFTELDAGVDAGADGGTDAGVDAGTDAGIDAGTDAGTDAGVDAGADAGVDAGLEPMDAGAEPGPPLELGVGCGCATFPPWSALLLLVMLRRRSC